MDRGGGKKRGIRFLHLSITFDLTMISSPPIMNRLREIDIELMRRLSPRVNVIPVLGRADSLTPTELKDFKKRVG